jgi:hypothetical protein
MVEERKYRTMLRVLSKDWIRWCKAKKELKEVRALLLKMDIEALKQMYSLDKNGV